MDRPNRDDNCIECPQMTTTKEEGSVSKEDCASEYAYKEGRDSSFSQMFLATGYTAEHRELTVGMAPALL